MHTEKPLVKLETKRLPNGKRLLQHESIRVIIDNTPIAVGMEGTIHEAKLVRDDRRWIAKLWILDPERLDPMRQRAAVIAEIRMHLLVMADPRVSQVAVGPQVCLAGHKNTSYYLVMDRFDYNLLQFIEAYPMHAPAVMLTWP